MFQTIVSAMSMLTPPMPLGNPGNQFRVDYIKSIAPLSDFEYTEVTHTHAHTGVSGVMSVRCLNLQLLELKTDLQFNLRHLQVLRLYSFTPYFADSAY